MRKITFYGSSDDLIYARDGDQTIAGVESLSFNENAVFKIEDANGDGFLVVAHYLISVSGTWSIGLAPLMPPKPLPSWPMEWRFGEEDYEAKLELAMEALAPTPVAPHSPVLEITIPDDAVVKIIHPADAGDLFIDPAGAGLPTETELPTEGVIYPRPDISISLN